MSFGVYFHIPYCLQRCSYCDFATYEYSRENSQAQTQLLPPEAYAQVVLEEMRQKLPSLQGKTIDTIYFGGGTPSLVSAEIIVDLMSGLEKQGLKISKNAERTIEINPATLDHGKMEIYLKSGINRFSVGAQTFDDALLKMVRREHNAQQTRETLKFLRDYGVNYSFDLLFALPFQTKEMLQKDLDEVLHFSPPHLSPYCLTVPESHPLTKNRPLEEAQIEMFELINLNLTAAGYERYEISNYSKPGFESRHNSLYWDDSEYVGFGLSAHSYLHLGPWGLRFWNEKSMDSYHRQITSFQGSVYKSLYSELPDGQFENLEIHQSLTDFCHISLRTKGGLSEKKLRMKFGLRIANVVIAALREICDRGLLEETQGHWRLTEEGLVLSNQVFSALTYLAGELPLA